MIKLKINNIINEISETISSIRTRKNVITINNNIYVSEDMKVEIIGDVQCDDIDIGGSLSVNGFITSASIDVGGSLKAKDINAQSIDAGGSINCEKIHGNTQAGGSINLGK